MNLVATLLAAAAVTLPAADPFYESAQKKLDSLQHRQVPRGSVVRFTPREINTWLQVKAAEAVPEGLRDLRVELAEGSGTGYAMADFLRMRQAKGQQTNWLVSRLIQGERPLVVAVRVESGAGRCIVHLTEVDIGHAVATGSVLDALIKTFFLPLYPDAKIDQQFELDFDMDRIDVHPSGVTVTLKK